MKKIFSFRLQLLYILLLALSPKAGAQSLFDEIMIDGDTLTVPVDLPDGKVLWPGYTVPVDTTLAVEDFMYNEVFYMPAVFDRFDIFAHEKAGDPLRDTVPAADTPTAFFDRLVLRDARQRYFLQQMMGERPQVARYSMSKMPRPPKKFIMHLDPSTAKLTVEEFKQAPLDTMKTLVPESEVNRINWLHTFDGSLQFSQAYVSANWYQGGKSNLNMIANVLYNIKLNPKFNPNVIFDTTVSYKLGLNNAPDDSVHAYNINEDILQINSKIGLKAWKRWYYSVTAQFKTQMLNNYKVNSKDLVSAFLSPAELNVGVGMTYSYANPRNTVQFTSAISPLSYNLKTCTNPNLNPTAFGIEEGKTSKSEYGSSTEITFKWKLSYNISFTSRLFGFTNYEYAQADWENTIDIVINKFITSRIYAHLRYDSQPVLVEDSKWGHFQFKEILSIGFAYRFSHI